MNIYDFKVKAIDGSEVSLDAYKGKALLIVNTASKCGFTPQFTELEALYKARGADGLVVLGFPCNQFAAQDPGDETEIKNFCSLNYDVTFPMFSKIDVNGKNADPLYKFLRTQTKSLFGSSVKWNFTKFLVDKKGNVVGRYAPTKLPADFMNDIETALKE